VRDKVEGIPDPRHDPVYNTYLPPTGGAHPRTVAKLWRTKARQGKACSTDLPHGETDSRALNSDICSPAPPQRGKARVLA